MSDKRIERMSNMYLEKCAASGRQPSKRDLVNVLKNRKSFQAPPERPQFDYLHPQSSPQPAIAAGPAVQAAAPKPSILNRVRQSFANFKDNRAKAAAEKAKLLRVAQINRQPRPVPVAQPTPVAQAAPAAQPVAQAAPAAAQVATQPVAQPSPVPPKAAPAMATAAPAAANAAQAASTAAPVAAKGPSRSARRPAAAASTAAPVAAKGFRLNPMAKAGLVGGVVAAGVGAMTLFQKLKSNKEQPRD